MNNTIVAISTALGNGSISIIRLSGDNAIEIVNKVFKGKNLLKVPTHTIHYGYIYYKDSIIDEVMVTIMRTPKTYTKEDVVEINCHGGILITKNILNILIENGAILAEPGEFTKRAFLNGRIDLAQAEAVMELINAKSNYAIKNSINKLNGKINSKINIIRNKILTEIAYIEACLDDPEHYELDNYGYEILDDIKNIKIEIDKMINDSKKFDIINSGINCAIIGLPNAGKSSLLNALLRKDRAIVTDIAGTTRDIIEEQLNINDILLNIIDTAGIRETDDLVESIGVKKSKDSIISADLVLYIIDSSQKLEKDNYDIFESLKGKNVIVILNKDDKPTNVDIKDIPSEFKNIVSISTLFDDTIKVLEDKITDFVVEKNIIADDELYIANERQRYLLEDAQKAITNVISGIEMGYSEDFLTIDLTQAYISLGKIIGEEVEEDIINKIFKDFCMGK